MAIAPFENALPVDTTLENQASSVPTGGTIGGVAESAIASYITVWRNQLRSSFIERRNIWDECWKLYRGLEDFSDKEDWQSKIVLPKSWASIKMATNTIKRLLSTAKKPWTLESINPDDLVTTIRSDQMTDLTRVFLDKAHFIEEFTTGLECGFILGLGVWKEWWGLKPRKRTRIETTMMPMPPTMGMSGGNLLEGNPDFRNYPPPIGQGLGQYQGEFGQQYPPQLPPEALNPMGWQAPGGMEGLQTAPSSPLMIPTKQLISEEVMEGQLFLRAVDPYNFYWLPGSKLNRWEGTIEEIEIPRYALLDLAEQGYLSKEKVALVQPRKIDERYRMSNLRFSETLTTINGPNNDTSLVKLTEYYGPIVIDGKIVEKQAHVILGNDTIVLLYQKNPFYHQKAPYIGFSPLGLPFRTEGVGLVEMVRQIDKGLSQLANLSVDTLMFRLLPLFEVTVDAFENPEDLETGITPGKMLRKNLGQSGIQGIKPVEFQDISSGTVQVAGLLDRSHQEGALISDIAEGMPRWRGQQTATESQLLQQQGDSFMGSMATDIEKQAIEPLVDMAKDLIFQFLDTANDPRVASILGVGADTLAMMSREEIMEMIEGDYKVKAVGITGQLQKAEMLQNLVQLMNLIGQNPEAWLPYVNQDALLRRILEAFRPTIHDIEDIICDPATAEAKKSQMQQQQLTPDLVGMIPQLVQLQQNQQQAGEDRGLELQRMEHERQMQMREQQMQMMQLQAQMAQAQQEQKQPEGGSQK